MDALEVVPGRNVGKLHIIAKCGNLDGEDLYLCRDESGRNIQFVESAIIAQAGEQAEPAEEVPVEEEVAAKEETPSEDEGEAPVAAKEVSLDDLMDKPLGDLEAQEIVTILIGAYGDNPPDSLTLHGLRQRLKKKKKKGGK